MIVINLLQLSVGHPWTTIRTVQGDHETHRTSSDDPASWRAVETSSTSHHVDQEREKEVTYAEKVRRIWCLGMGRGYWKMCPY